jgi:hypothetical protein
MQGEPGARWEILRQLPDLIEHLRPGATMAELERAARAQSDLEAAQKMQQAKHKLFESFHRKRRA